MELYTKEPDKIVRVTIISGKSRINFAYIHATADEVIAKAKSIIKDNIAVDIFSKTSRITVSVRECMGGKNGKTKQFSFPCTDIEKVHNLLLKNLK